MFNTVNQPSQTAIQAQAPISEHAAVHQSEGLRPEQLTRSPDTNRFLTPAEQSAVAQLAERYPQQVKQAYQQNVPFEAVGLSTPDVQQPTQAQPGQTATPTPAAGLTETAPQQVAVEPAQAALIPRAATGASGQAQFAGAQPQTTRQLQPATQAQPAARTAQSPVPAPSVPVEATPNLTRTTEAQPTAVQQTGQTAQPQTAQPQSVQTEQTAQPHTAQPQTIQTLLPTGGVQQTTPAASQASTQAALAQPAQAGAQPTQSAQTRQSVQTQSTAQPAQEAQQFQTARPAQEAQTAQTGVAVEQPAATQQFPAAQWSGVTGAGTNVPGPY